MTSMVMNIYSSRAAEIISSWDENNADPETNTIDRHIESYPGLVAITTIPFLAGHADDRTSTLWGFQNTQYLEMIADSERLLAEKIEQYKLESNS